MFQYDPSAIRTLGGDAALASDRPGMALRRAAINHVGATFMRDYVMQCARRDSHLTVDMQLGINSSICLIRCAPPVLTRPIGNSPVQLTELGNMLKCFFSIIFEASVAAEYDAPKQKFVQRDVTDKVRSFNNTLRADFSGARMLQPETFARKYGATKAKMAQIFEPGCATYAEACAYDPLFDFSLVDRDGDGSEKNRQSLAATVQVAIKLLQASEESKIGGRTLDETHHLVHRSPIVVQSIMQCKNHASASPAPKSASSSKVPVDSAKSADAPSLSLFRRRPPMVRAPAASAAPTSSVAATLAAAALASLASVAAPVSAGAADPTSPAGPTSPTGPTLPAQPRLPYLDGMTTFDNTKKAEFTEEAEFTEADLQYFIDELLCGGDPEPGGRPPQSTHSSSVDPFPLLLSNDDPDGNVNAKRRRVNEASMRNLISETDSGSGSH